MMDDMEYTDNAQNAQNAEKPTKQDKTINWKSLYKWAYKLRSVVLAIPVAIGAVVLAIFNHSNLPDVVGINIQASGEYAETISRSVAVFGPLAVTAVCLLMVFISRRVLYPWLIALFSLALPLLIYVTNTFPG